MLEAHGLKKTHRQGSQEVPAVREATLSVEAGDFAVVEGISGSGKSTLLHLLAGLDRPDSGSVFIDGTDLGTLNENGLARLRLATVGFIFQSFNLLPTLSARANVEVAMIGARCTGAQRREKATQLLDQVGMAGRASHIPARLSGGEQQRVAIARALANDPAIIFADEPTGDLDTHTGAAVIEMLRDLCVERKAAVVVVTHAPYVAEYASIRALMNDGILVREQ